MSPAAPVPPAAGADPTSESAASTASYSERLWPGPLGWVVTVGLAVMFGIALVPVSVLAGVIALVVAFAAGCGALVILSTPIRVSGGELRAGSAHVPVSLLHHPEALDVDATRMALGPELDARAYLVLRSWAKRSVRVRLDDPADPTPYWLVSTRHPEKLASAIAGASASSHPAGSSR